jgi:heme/copper-type cytochrome/quinol oxidase subunit 3
MDNVLRERPVLDVSSLPNVAFGSKNVTWLANVLYMTIEGTMFALLIASYFYLRMRSTDWPPGNSPPYLWFGVANSILFLLSVLPAHWVKAKAPMGDRSKVRLGLFILSLFGAACILVRIYEFTALNCRWSDNAYASCVWVLIGMHSGHILTEWIETLTLLGVSFTNKMEGTRLADAAINSDYWYFVVASGWIINFIIYATPRFL